MPYGKKSYNSNPGGSASKQTADSAQKGPGQKPVTSKGTRSNSAPGYGKAGNTKSGTSTGSNRGKDNY